LKDLQPINGAVVIRDRLGRCERREHGDDPPDRCLLRGVAVCAERPNSGGRRLLDLPAPEPRDDAGEHNFALVSSRSKYMKKEKKIALLIDCDNASYKVIDGVLNELAKYGVTNIRRAYGNWKTLNLQGWEDQLHPYVIQPVQQFAYTQGKNATDAAMIIQAMDLLYTQQLDAFVLMTSDSPKLRSGARRLTPCLSQTGLDPAKRPLIRLFSEAALVLMGYYNHQPL